MVIVAARKETHVDGQTGINGHGSEKLLGKLAVCSYYRYQFITQKRLVFQVWQPEYPFYHA